MSEFNIDAPIYERSRLVFSDTAIQKLFDAHILLAGVGGVGGFVAESLVRAGIGQITLIDNDIVKPSNLNRQIVALHSTCNQFKVDVMRNRIMDINPYCIVHTKKLFISPENVSSILESNLDYVVDAIDSLNCKVALVATAYEKKIKVISSMGAGRRIDATKIMLTDLFQTKYCALARNMRQRLRRQGINKGIKAVFSTEIANPTGPLEDIKGSRARVVNGTVSYLPAIFGFMLASEVIRDITHKTTNKE